MSQEQKLSPHKQRLYDRAKEERERCFEWIKQFVVEGQPRAFTKAELCRAAQEDLNVSKNCFNGTWIWVIEETGRHDWYEPLRKSRIQKN